VSRGIGVLGATAIGVGGMVGGGIFAVLGTAVSLARGATPVAFLIAGAIALLTSYAYAKLTARYHEAGGTVVFIDRAFGVDLATGVVNLVLWLGYLVTISLYAAAFGAYAATFVPAPHPPWLIHALISTGIIVPALLNLLDAELVSRYETYVVVSKLMILAIVVVAGIPYVDPSAFAVSQWVGPENLVAGGMVIFVAYEGFELIANAGADARDPETTLPRALYASVGFVIVLYVLVAIVTVGSVSLATIEQSKDYALAAAARPALGQVGFTLVAVSALMATFSAINATIYGNARLGFTLAKDGELPEVFERKTWNRPVGGVMLTAGLALALANLVDLQAIAILGSAGFLIIFAVVNAAAVRLAAEIGASRIVTGAGAFACVAALGTLLVHTYDEDPRALVILAAMIGGALAFELVYPRLTGRPLRLRPGSEPPG